MMSAALQGELPVEIVSRFLNSAPVDLDSMARALGLEVENRWFDETDTAGMIKRVGRTYRISLNHMDNPRRKRFTLAHEIAHYILHRDLVGDGITDHGLYRSHLSDTVERQANRYAANLLMPSGLVRAAWREGDCSIAGMATRFNVSENAARIRLKELGYGA